MSGPIWILPAFALIAAGYASVGLGGATAYAAILSLTAVPYTQIPCLALGLNLLAAGSAYAGFHRAGRVPYSLLGPLLATSVPAAFVGGLIPLRERHFLALLALALLLAGARFLLGSTLLRALARGGGAPGPPRGLLPSIGLGIGLLAGMTGIGGGVYLAPVLLLGGVGDLETVPAITSGFVFLNSAAGLAGQLVRVDPSFDLWLPLGAAVAVGALVGTTASLRWVPTAWMQRVFGALLITAALLNGAKAL